jgi:hypothetical protein
LKLFNFNEKREKFFNLKPRVKNLQRQTAAASQALMEIFSDGVELKWRRFVLEILIMFDPKVSTPLSSALL